MEKSTFSPLYEIFKTKLVEMRKNAGLSQRQFAALLERERSFVSRIELGERRVDLVEFFWICRACDHDPQAVTAELMREFVKREGKGEGKRKSRRR